MSAASASEMRDHGHGADGRREGEMERDDHEREHDDGLGSGPWTGFFLDPRTGNRRWRKDLVLQFAGGVVRGSGRDAVGEFIIRGRYDVSTREVTWTKRYVGAHDVYYRGFAEIRGIWGTWELSGLRGGFHIWPEGSGGDLELEGQEACDEPQLASRRELVEVLEDGEVLEDLLDLVGVEGRPGGDDGELAVTRDGRLRPASG